MEGWIKLHRKFTEWEWFDTEHMVKLFLYLVLSANHKDGNWRGIDVKRGQLITGLHTLGEKTKISVQSLRTCLTRLEKTGEINTESTNKYRIITICNYDSYQSEQQATNKQDNKQVTNNQQSTNNQSTTNKNVKKEENNNNDKKLLSELNSSDDLSEYENIAFSFWQLSKHNIEKYNINSTNLEKSKLKVWVDPVRLAVESDKRTIEDFREIFNFLKNEIPNAKGFSWSKNIRSTSKLREKFEDLLLASRSGKKDDYSELKEEILNTMQK